MKEANMEEMDNAIRSFLKVIGLGRVKLSRIDPNFDYLEDSDIHQGYLNKQQKIIYLLSIFCEEKRNYYQDMADSEPTWYYNKVTYWAEKRFVCDSLLSHILRRQYDISYNYGLKVVDDYLLVSYEYEAVNEGEYISVFLN